MAKSHSEIYDRAYRDGWKAALEQVDKYRDVLISQFFEELVEYADEIYTNELAEMIVQKCGFFNLNLQTYMKSGYKPDLEEAAGNRIKRLNEWNL